MSGDERREVADQVSFYRRWRSLFQRGRFLRLLSPFEGDGNETAWMVVAHDRSSAVAGHYRVLNHPVPGPARLRLRGLDPGRSYRVSVWPEGADEVAQANATVRGGDDLMAAGLILDGSRDAAATRGDFSARLFILEAIRPAGRMAGGR
jgi:alpha-galactosidase